QSIHQQTKALRLEPEHEPTRGNGTRHQRRPDDEPSDQQLRRQCAERTERYCLAHVCVPARAPRAATPLRIHPCLRGVGTISLRVLGFAVAERPVFPGDLDEVDEKVLRPEARIICEQCSGTRHEVPLLRRLASRGKRDLHQHHVIASLDAEIRRIVDQSVGVVLGDDLEPIVLRCGERLDHGAMNAIGDRPPVFGRLSGAQGNTNKWHGSTPSVGLRTRFSHAMAALGDCGGKVESDPTFPFTIASMRWVRLAKIWLIALKYGLDEFLLGHERFAWLRPTVRALTFWRDLSAPRAERLRLALEALGPIFVKFGQMLSTRRDLIPPDIADELAKLQDRVPPFPTEQVIATLERLYGKPVAQVFKTFELEPVASASVAQVHLAELPDGTLAAVKVLRPDIAATIEKDLALMQMGAWAVETLWREGKRLRPRAVVAEFDKTIHDELDLA